MSYNTSFFGGGSGGGGGVTTFTALTDTPASYSGQAGKVVKVNGAENALVFEEGGNITPIDSAYENVAALVAATDIVNGDTVATYGYHALSDGGQMVYTVTNTDLSADVDGGSVIALANSLYAQAQFPDVYRPEMWGAKHTGSTADASSNVTALNAMFLYCNDSNIKPMVFSAGTYYINDICYLPVKQAAYQWRYYGNGCTIRTTGRNTTTTGNFTIQTGSVTVTVADETGFAVGEQLRLLPQASSVTLGAGAHNFMQGEITGISGRDITVDVTETRLFEKLWQKTIDLDALGATAGLSGAGSWQGFVVGQTLRFEYDASNYFTADVTYYQSNGNLGLENIAVTGSGSYDRWKVTVTDMTYNGTWRVKGGIEMFKRLIPDQTYAAGAVSSKVQFDGFNFQGSGADGLDIGIAYACAYGSSITNMTFNACYKGWWGQFMLMTYYANIMVYCDIGMDCTYGYEWGGNTANAASNVATMDNVRSFAANGAKASIRVLGSNSYYLLNFIEEGYPKQYGIWWDAVHSTNTINLRLEEVHLEVSDIDSFIRVDRIQVVRITIDGIYPQYGNIIVNNTDTNSPAYLTLRAYYWIGLTYLYRGSVDVYHEVPSAAYPSSSGFGSGKNTWPDDLGRVGTIYGTGTTQPTFGTGSASYDFGTGSLTGNGINGAGGGNSWYAAQNVFAIGGNAAILHIKGRQNNFWGENGVVSAGSSIAMDIVHSGTTNPQPLRIYSGSTNAANFRWYRSSGTKTHYNDLSYRDGANATQMWSIPNTAGQAGQVLKHDGVADMNWADITSADIGVYPTVAALVAATDYASGDVVQTQGYYTQNDGGQNTYTVTNTDLSASVDGGSVIDLGSGLYAQAQFSEYYTPEQFGAKGTNSSADADTNVTAFTALFAYMVRNNRPLKMSSLTYYLNESVPMLQPVPNINNFASAQYVIDGGGATIRSTGRGTSTADSLVFQRGTVTMTVASSTQRFQTGETICISKNSNRMLAKVVSYSGTTMEAEIYEVNGYEISVWRSGQSVDFAIGASNTVNTGNSSAQPHGFLTGMKIRAYTGAESTVMSAIATGTVTGYTTTQVTFTIDSNESPVYTSASNHTVASSGNKTFNITPNSISDNFAVGTRVRVTSQSDPTAWMEGATYGKDTIHLYITIDTSNGSGTFNAWDVQAVGMGENFVLQTVEGGSAVASWGVRGGITMFDRSIAPVEQVNDSLFAGNVSNTSLPVTWATGSQTFVVDSPIITDDMTGYVVELWDGDAYLRGRVTAYNTTTGETTANFVSIYGSGTRQPDTVSFVRTTLDQDTTTSTTSLTLGKGTQNLTVSPLGYDATGYWAKIEYKESSDSGDNRYYDQVMYGEITAYNDSTGAMTVTTTGNNGTGTYNNWVVVVMPVSPVVSFTIPNIAWSMANGSVFLEYSGGDLFTQRDDTPSGNRVYLSGYLLSHDPTTGAADMVVTGARGNGSFGYWRFVYRGPDRDANYISDRAVAAKFDISNLNFQGGGDTSLDVGLKWSNSYGSSIRNSAMTNCFIGFYGLFNLNCTIEEIMVTGNGYGLWGTVGDWGVENTQCNVTWCRQVRHFGQSNAIAGIRVTQSNAWTFIKYIHEGRGARYGVWLDTQGDTTVKSHSLDFVHLETTNLRNFLYVTNGGQLTDLKLHNLYSQFKNVDVEASSFFRLHKIYNVGGSVVWNQTDRVFAEGYDNAFDVNDKTFYWAKSLPFYFYGWGRTSLGSSAAGKGISFSGNNGADTGYRTWGFSMGDSGSISPAYIFNVGTGSNIRTEYRTSKGYLYGGSGTMSLGLATNDFTLFTKGTHFSLWHTDGLRYTWIRNQGTSSAGSMNGRIIIRDELNSTNLYALPFHSGTNGQVQKFDNTSGNPLMEWGFVDFLELGDVSNSSYTGLAGAIPTVNAGETGMELVAPADTGEVIKSTATGTAYGNVFGQIVSLTYDTTTATVSIPTGGGLRPLAYSINFKATATAMLIELQCYVAIAAGETITAGLSDNSGTFNDVGTTALGLATNGASGATTLSVVKTWYVTGLTVGTSYIWYPSVESTGASSTIRVGVGVSPFVIKAIHGAV